MTEVGYLALFISSFLSATVLPMSSEAVVVAMIIGGFDVMLTITVATIGNVLGSMTTYWLGYIGDWKRISRWIGITSDKAERFMSHTQKYGAWFGLLVWVPAIGDVIALCLGLLRISFWESTVMITIGKAARYIVLAYLTIKGIELI